MVTKVEQLFVLIVDDDDMMRSYLRIILKEVGVKKIEETGDAEKTLRLLKSRQPHLILLDINLPDADGVDILKKIRSDYPACRVVMVSGESSIERVKTTIKEGAMDFIAKPFNASIVEQKIRHVVNSFS